MSKYKKWLAAHAGDCDAQGEASINNFMHEILALLQIMVYDTSWPQTHPFCTS